MKTIKKLKLNNLSIDELKRKDLNLVRGGGFDDKCKCACICPCPGSIDNAAAADTDTIMNSFNETYY